MATPEAPVKILDSSYHQHLLEHFMGLSEHDRQFRFNGCTKGSVEDYLSKIDFTRDKVLGVWKGNSVLVGVGHLYFFESHKVAHISLSVDPNFRKLGYGQALMECAKEIARASSCSKLKILCSAHNIPIKTLATKNGFCVITCKDNEWEGALTL